MKKYPFCSVIVLNYFGEKVLAQTLDSLINLDYPKDKYEIIVVDNNSKDKSRQFLIEYSKSNKIIKPLLLNQNFGFSKGNNFGIKQAKGEYVALINNDCVAGKKWLEQLVTTAQKDKDIFAVNSKILLYPKYIKINFTTPSKLVPVYAWISRSKLYDYSGKELIYLPMWKKSNDSLISCDIELAYDPFADKTVDFNIIFSLRGHKPGNLKIEDIISFENKGVKITKVDIKGDEIECKIRVKLLDLAISSQSRDKIQNAGIMVFQDGYGRDIGALVRDSQQYYEFDLKQYDKEKEIYAACGAAVLYNKKILDKIGYLDETFFMYYEDVEICERARFAGFKSVYNPGAVVRHFHALSSKEASSFFVYHVERGRLLHLLYNFPFSIFLKQFLYMSFLNTAILLKIILSFRRFFYIVKSRKASDNESKFTRRIQIIKALAFFIFNFPLLYMERIKRDGSRRSKAVNENYQKILEGGWYLK